MLLSTFTYAALAHSLTASAATMTVTVAANNKFQFTPNSITAQPGDTVAFNFVSQNHSVASSNANTPCQPQRNAIFSDFQPVAAPASGAGNSRAKGETKLKISKALEGPVTAKASLKSPNNNRQAANTPMFMLPVTDTQPMYIYCSQAQHCQQGMVMIINPPDDGAVQQYANKAAKARNNVSPRGGVSGGSVVNDAAGTTPRNGVLGANQGDAATTGKGKGKNGGAGAGAGAGVLAGLLGRNGKGKNNK